MSGAFWVCFLEAEVAYAHLDLDCPKDQRILTSTFVDQSSNDIRQHFHSIVSNWFTLEILELHSIAKFIFDQREKLKDEEKERNRKGGGRERGGKGGQRERPT